MLETTILNNLEKLPESFKQEVLHYTEFLVEKYAKQLQQEQPQKKKRKAGLLKGKIWMADDFDEPLEDFKDYKLRYRKDCCRHEELLSLHLLSPGNSDWVMEQLPKHST